MSFAGRKNFSRVLLWAILLLAGWQACAAGEATGGYDIAIRNVTVISPERAAPLYAVTVVVKGETIVEINNDASGLVAGSVIDGTGKYLIPGLIDSHVHLYHASGLKEKYTQNYDKLYSAYMAQLPRSYLYYGFTTLLEPNMDEETNQQFLQTPVHPDLQHCGHGLILSDGFMALDFPREQLLAKAPNFLYDRYRQGYMPAAADPAAHTPAATVARIAASGAICVKLYYEEALWMPGDKREFALPSVEIVRDVVNEAHKRNLRVMLHATSPKGYQVALAGGVDVIAHGPWDWDGNDYSNPQIPAQVLQALTDASAAGVAIQPTVSALQQTASMFKPALLADPALSKVLSAAYIQYLRTEAQQQRDLFLRVFGALVIDEPAAENVGPAILAMVDRYKRMVGTLAQHGAHLIFGTDTASGGFGWGNPPGLNGYWELQDWAQSGVPLDVIFRAVTLENAQAFGLDAEIGSVEAGKRANLLLLRANPLESIEAYDQIDLVILRGQVLAREQLIARPE